ncbi:MAG: UDP-glucose 4-epimerase, partial [Acidimicrobiaceae bacterium]|nr:UDP-glucose 4-epimerase [Acidimicrobiaceae bacterium]
NIGTGQQTSVNELYQRLAELAGVAEPPLRGPARDGEVRNSALDATRAMSRLSWQPRVDLSEGLGATLEAARASLAMLA